MSAADDTAAKDTAVQPMTPTSWGDYRLLVESLVDYAIFLLDADGRVASWNLGSEKINGYSANEVVGTHFSRFYPAEDIAAGKPERELEIAREVGRVEDEGWRLRKDGTRFWARVVITALRDERGELRGFGKVTRDLTARREAEEHLRQADQRFHHLIDAVIDYAIFMLDTSGHVSTWNAGARRVKGYTAEEIIGKHFSVFYPAEDRAAHKPEQVLETVRREGRFEQEALRVRKDGSRFWASVIITALRDENGILRGFVKVTRDLTERRKTEQIERELLREQTARAVAEQSEAVLRQSEERYRALSEKLEVVVEGVKFLSDVTVALGVSLDKDEMVATLCSMLVPKLGDWCAVYLREADKLRGVEIVHADPEKRAIAREYLASHVPDPELQGGSWEVVRTGQSMLNNDISDELLERAVRDEGDRARLRSLGLSAVLSVPFVVRDRILGALIVGTGQPGRRYDAQQLALAEEIGRRAGFALENAQLYLDAQQAAKVADEASRAKDEFLATVSHELRTPLSAILGWAKLLKDRVNDATMTKPLEVIHRNAQAQVKIIDDILDVSRVITGKFKLESKPTDLLSITRDAIDVVRQSAVAKRIHIALSPEQGFFLLEADPERLQQAVWNLLSNAVKFTETGGRIEVEIGQRDSQLVLSVKDTGIGIDSRFLPYVFDRFKQADSSTTRRVSGLGLGLALVRHIVELHGGRVGVASDGPGTGSTFTISLPVRAVARAPSERQPERRTPTTAPLASVALPGARVLIVDDEPDARALVTELLTERGAAVESAGSAQEAFDTFRRFRPDILVSDIGMPMEDGISLIKRIRALAEADGGNIPAIALTAFARDTDSARAIEAGYSAHLGKPVEPDALVLAIAKLVTRPTA